MKNHANTIETSDLLYTSRKNQRVAEKYCEWLNRCKSWNGPRTLDEAYKNPSRYKWVAYHRCLDLCASLDGFDFRITAAGCQTFSVCFWYWGKETGALCFAYITRDYDRFCFVNEAA